MSRQLPLISRDLQEPPQRYAWWIVCVAFLMLMVSNGLALAGLTVLDPELIKTFQCSREALKRGELIQLLSVGVLAPLIGSIADRYSLRALVTIGLILLSGGLYGYHHISSLNQLYALRAVLGVALACSGLVMAVLMVSRWFQVKRGLAIGVTLVGSSLGNMLFARLNPTLINPEVTEGWREAFPTLALIPLALIPFALSVRDRPRPAPLPEEESSHEMSTEEPAEAQEVHIASTESIPYEVAIRSRQFWLIAVAAMLTFYSILGVSSHLPLYLNQSQGMSLTEAGGMVGIVFAMSLVGKLVWGVLADHVNHRYLFSINLALMGLGSALLSCLQFELFWGFLICFGFGWGGIYTIIQLLVVGSFGVRDAGKILGTLTLLDALGGGLGPWLTGYLFDLTDSYLIPFSVITGMIALVFLSSFALRPLLHERERQINGEV